ncbi:MAG: hypothetical protein ACI4U0_02370 [Candidatus Aphodocola sp.]
MGNNDRLTELRIDEWIWITFIILSALNIFGDECEKDFCIHHDVSKDRIAKKIFTFTVFVSLLIYCYLAYQRYGRLQMKRSINQNVSLEEMRFFGSILVVVASFIFLYYQFETTTADNPSIE